MRTLDYIYMHAYVCIYVWANHVHVQYIGECIVRLEEHRGQEQEVSQ